MGVTKSLGFESGSAFSHLLSHVDQLWSSMVSLQMLSFLGGDTTFVGFGQFYNNTWQEGSFFPFGGPIALELIRCKWKARKSGGSSDWQRLRKGTGREHDVLRYSNSSASGNMNRGLKTSYKMCQGFTYGKRMDVKTTSRSRRLDVRIEEGDGKSSRISIAPCTLPASSVISNCDSFLITSWHVSSVLNYSKVAVHERIHRHSV